MIVVVVVVVVYNTVMEIHNYFGIVTEPYTPLDLVLYEYEKRGAGFDDASHTEWFVDAVLKGANINSPFLWNIKKNVIR